MADGFWLLVLAVLAAATVWLAGGPFRITDLLTLGLIITIIAALIAPRIAGWLVAPYAESIFRRLLWGLPAAALLLPTVHIALAVALFIQQLPIGLRAAGLGAFQGAGLFTLVIAIPMGVFFVIWGWLRRRSPPQDRTARPWRRALPIALVVGVAFLLYREGVYFQSLKFTS
ncbi:MAG: hypothetical protein ACHQPH_02825 [Reyranellales bacterium]